MRAEVTERARATRRFLQRKLEERQEIERETQALTEEFAEQSRLPQMPAKNQRHRQQDYNYFSFRSPNHKATCI